MEKKSDRYENKPIRFYDKGDHYELWFMDDFTNPGSGKMMKSGSEYTLICDIAEELFNGDINKELHIFIWSYGGLVDTLSTVLQGISRYRRKVAVNLGVCDSAGCCSSRAMSDTHRAIVNSCITRHGCFLLAR